MNIENERLRVYGPDFQRDKGVRRQMMLDMQQNVEGAKALKSYGNLTFKRLNDYYRWLQAQPDFGTPKEPPAPPLRLSAIRRASRARRGAALTATLREEVAQLKGEINTLLDDVEIRDMEIEELKDNLVAIQAELVQHQMTTNGNTHQVSHRLAVSISKAPRLLVGQAEMLAADLVAAFQGDEERAADVLDNIIERSTEKLRDHQWQQEAMSLCMEVFMNPYTAGKKLGLPCELHDVTGATHTADRRKIRALYSIHEGVPNFRRIGFRKDVYRGTQHTN
jgi:hypothetical protein